MRFVLIAIAVVTLSLGVAVPARAEDMMHCDHSSTIASLRACVQHALQEGHIDNQGIARSLIAKLDAAQSAYDQGQNAVAIRILEAFVQEVTALAGQSIISDHAAHLVEHAQMVIQALSV